jgi:hypothetical protein
MSGFLHKLYQIYKKPILHHLKLKASTLPKVEFTDELLNNTRVLAKRNALLKKLPKNGVVAELGVDEGLFSKEIIDICNPKKLFLVDTWSSARFSIEKKQNVERKFKAEIESSQIEVIQNNSISASKNFAPHSFDWIYIDTDHSFETTLSELKAYAPKIKINGYMAGHDFTPGSFHDVVRFGVIEAVKTFCVQNNWELSYLTLDANNYQSFAIKRKQQ